MFYENLDKICRQKNTTPTAIVKKLGLSTSKVTAWKNGSVPKQEIMQLLAKTLDTSVDNFFLDEAQKKTTILFSSEDVTYMEVIGSVKAGYDGIAYEEHTGKTEAIPTAFFGGGEKSDFFLLRVSGSSMYPKMLDGDLVLVKRETTVDSGSIAVVLYADGEATIKTVKYKKGQAWLDLIPANPEYETKHIEGADLKNFRILGKVVKLIRDL